MNIQRSGEKNFEKLFFNVALIAVFLAAGLWLGPHLRPVYDRFFSEPDYVTGNYDALYEQTAKPVVMFSTSICPYCRHARELLRRKNVDYQEFVIDKSPEARRQFEALGGSGVPLLFIGNRRIAGFREQTIRDSLATIQQ